MHVQPKKAGLSPVEKNVKSGTNTASPSPIPHALRARVIASVPFAQVMQCFTPTYSASSFSRLGTAGPEMKFAPTQTSLMLLSISSCNFLYCFCKSLNFIFRPHTTCRLPLMVTYFLLQSGHSYVSASIT